MPKRPIAEPPSATNLLCPGSLFQVEPTDAESAQTVEGTKVLWEIFPGMHIPGTIERDNGDGTYALDYDDGDKEDVGRQRSRTPD